jgi:hypothetical protein
MAQSSSGTSLYLWRPSGHPREPSHLLRDDVGIKGGVCRTSLARRVVDRALVRHRDAVSYGNTQAIRDIDGSDKV